jgi:lipoprotein-anchoring transpeptidase ErfK/SrfK
MQKLFAVLVCGVMATAASPVFATQDTGTDSGTSTGTATAVATPLPEGQTPAVSTPGSVDLSPAVSIAPNISETYRFAPTLPRNTGIGKRIVYSNSFQWVWVIDKDNKLVRSMPVSGRRGIPAPGTYKVTTKSPWSYSLDFEGVDFRWMTRFATGPAGGNIGFHEIPRKDGKPMQTYAQLGSFAGSGCVRMATEDVKFIYRWAEPGTPVIVTR